MGQYVDFYCGNENKELKRIVNSILKKKFPWISQKDYDDFYSIAALVVWDCERKFDKGKVKTEQFHGFVVACINNKIKTHVTFMNRCKRSKKDEDGNILQDYSLDVPLNNEDDSTLGDIVADDFLVEKHFFEERDDTYSEEMQKYLSKLSDLQREVLRLISIGFTPSEILSELHINKTLYDDCYNAIHSYRNISILI